MGGLLSGGGYWDKDVGALSSSLGFRIEAFEFAVLLLSWLKIF